MNVIFDYSIFFHQKYGGISRYFLKLHDELNKNNINSKIIAPINNNIFLKNHQLDYAHGIYLKDYPRFTRKILKNFNYLFSSIYAKIKKPDIIHKTFYEKNFNEDKNIKKVITVYDLAHEIYHNEYNKPSNHRPKKNSLENVDRIICPSNKTKNDLIDFYGIPSSKIEVIYMGTNKFFENDNEQIVKSLTKPFILYVGDRKRYKNFLNLLKAFALSSKLQNDFCLVCCGGGQFSKEELDIINKYKINRSQILQFDVNDDDLFHLYKNAQIFVFPSKYEGLGMPPLEAMSLGCPVVSSNHEAILEAVGDAACLFNPNEPEDIKFNIENVIYSSEKINDLKNRGFERSKLFTWTKCAKETLNIYKEILN